MENGWLRYEITYCFDNVYLVNRSIRYWSNTALEENLSLYLSSFTTIIGIKYSQDDEHDSPAFYISVYAALTGIGLVLRTVRWFILYNGSICASHVLYERLLERIQQEWREDGTMHKRFRRQPAHNPKDLSILHSSHLLQNFGWKR